MLSQPIPYAGITQTWTGNHTFAPASGNTAFAKPNSTFASGVPTLFAYSTDSMAADLGATISMGGSYTGTSPTVFAAVSGRKANGVSSDIGGYLSLGASKDGVGIVEGIRINPTTDVNIKKGITPDGGGMKHARVTTGSVASAAAPLITITWATPFADDQYTVVASVLDSTSSSLALRVAHVETITASAVTVRLKNDAAVALTGTVHVIAIHD